MSVSKAELSGHSFSQTLSCHHKSWPNFDVIAPTLPKHLQSWEQFMCLQRGVRFQWGFSLCESHAHKSFGRPKPFGHARKQVTLTRILSFFQD